MQRGPATTRIYLPPAPLGIEHWSEALPILEEHFPEWSFDTDGFE